MSDYRVQNAHGGQAVGGHFSSDIYRQLGYRHSGNAHDSFQRHGQIPGLEKPLLIQVFDKLWHGAGELINQALDLPGIALRSIFGIQPPNHTNQMIRDMFNPESEHYAGPNRFLPPNEDTDAAAYGIGPGYHGGHGHHAPHREVDHSHVSSLRHADDSPYTHQPTTTPHSGGSGGDGHHSGGH